MTKEELKKEAEEYVKQNYCEMCVMADDCKSGCIDCFTVQVYIASAEPREKRIEELQHKIDILQGYLDRDVEYQELQKENAELKEKNKWYSEQVCYKECAEEWGKLTKAKEIIKKLIEAIHIWDCKNLEEVEVEAEQFLNSEVEK